MLIPEISLRIREAKRRLGMLRQKKRQLRNPSSDGKTRSGESKCTCRKEESKKKRSKKSQHGINCFFVDKMTWKTPPRWHGKRFRGTIYSSF